MLVTKKAPDFNAKAVLGNNEIVDFNLYQNLGSKGAVVFFYPLDFTFVCPTELIAFDHRFEEFQARGINVIGVSIDSHFSHLAWKNTAVDQGGVGQLRYPMVADITKSIAKDFDVLLDGGIALRGSFLIDKDGTVRHAVVNDLPLGRNIDEMLRMVDAMLYTNEHGEVCPAGWNKDKKAMKADATGVASYLAENASSL
ncbi:MAG: peroxiredoxin [Candidatus Sericytochromatia bacterium]